MDRCWRDLGPVWEFLDVVELGGFLDWGCCGWIFVGECWRKFLLGANTPSLTTYNIRIFFSQHKNLPLPHNINPTFLTTLNIFHYYLHIYHKLFCNVILMILPITQFIIRLRCKCLHHDVYFSLKVERSLCSK